MRLIRGGKGPERGKWRMVLNTKKKWEETTGMQGRVQERGMPVKKQDGQERK